MISIVTYSMLVVSYRSNYDSDKGACPQRYDKAPTGFISPPALVSANVTRAYCCPYRYKSRITNEYSAALSDLQPNQFCFDGVPVI